MSIDDVCEYCLASPGHLCKIHAAKLVEERDRYREALSKIQGESLPMESHVKGSRQDPAEKCTHGTYNDEFVARLKTAMEQTIVAGERGNDLSGPLHRMRKVLGWPDKGVPTSDECKGMYDKACGECSRCAPQFAEAKESQDRLAAQSSDSCPFCQGTGMHLAPDVAEPILVPCSKKGCRFVGTSKDGNNG